MEQSVPQERNKRIPRLPSSPLRYRKENQKKPEVPEIKEISPPPLAEVLKQQVNLTMKL